MNRLKTYINEVFSYDSTIYDLRSIAFYNIGKYKASLKNINMALMINSTDKRLINNKHLIKDKL